jgi:hypothetical protein
MSKIMLKKVFINPKENYSLVDESNPNLFRDDEGNGYLNLNNGSINFQKLVSTFMVDDPKAVSPIWYKKLKELGINIPQDAVELEVESIDEEEYSYRVKDGSFVKVPAEKVFTSNDGFVALIDGIIKKLNKRTIKKYSISGVNVGSEYFYNKLLGLEQKTKK